MKILAVTLVAVFGAVGMACSDSPSSSPVSGIPAIMTSSTATPVARAAPTPTVTATPAPAPTATPVARATPTPAVAVTAIPAPTATQVIRAALIPAVAAAPTATPTATPVARATSAVTSSSLDFRVDFPDWVGESPIMALKIADSDVIARARFLSLDSTTKKDPNREGAYVAELAYKFEIIEYLKGEGHDELTVGMNSGPKFIAYPDWIGRRTEEEAQALAASWMESSRSIFANRGEGILFLLQSHNEGQHLYFTSVTDGEGGGDYPIVGETWLDFGEDSMYRHRLTDREIARISLAEVISRIEDIGFFTEGEYGQCVVSSLYERSKLRERILGTYLALILGGYYEPEPPPRYMVKIDADETGGAYAPVFQFRRPPYRAPKFSDYWLDGTDRELFTIDNFMDPGITGISFESVIPVSPLPEGEFSIYYGQYHQSLPCDTAHWRGDGWRSADTAQWVVIVAANRRD